jgi:thymidylate synthase ThyX
MPLDEASTARIAPFVTSTTADVFAVSGLPEETVAVLFAYSTRTGEDFRSSLARLLADGFLDVPAPVARTSGEGPSERANTFHDRWAELYGHASVAEHAVLHLVVENVSLLAAKALEDARLGSFAEKSTRFVAFDRPTFVALPELPAEVGETCRVAADRLFAAYLDLLPKTYAALRARAARAEGASDAEHDELLRGQTCDLLRGLLPAGVQTQLAMTLNARALAALIGKLLSNPLAEVRRIGGAVLEVARQRAPRLLRDVAPSDYRAALRADVDEAMRIVYTPPEEGAGSTMVITQPVRLVRHDRDAAERIALALAYEGSDSRAHAYGFVEGLRQATPRELESIVRAALARRGPHDPPPRALEASSMTFELMLDFGAYRDLQRHRMLTPATQRLSCRLGFETPSQITNLGFELPYQEAMLAAHHAWTKLEETHPLESQYVVPLGFRVRTLWTLDLRELFHVIELRSSRRGHPSYRRIAQALYRTSSSVHPFLKDLIRVELD